VQIHAGSPVV